MVRAVEEIDLWGGGVREAPIDARGHGCGAVVDVKSFCDTEVDCELAKVACGRITMVEEVAFLLMLSLSRQYKGVVGGVRTKG